jgi:PHD/YefM family antitoxin component YafN of YafNO toxin-antitoxin module
MINISEFRSNIRKYFKTADETPVAVHRNSDVYVLMSKAHYIGLINKAKMPRMMEMPTGVQTVVHFTTQTTTN